MALIKSRQSGSHDLLGRILETPDLVAVVQSLEPRALYQLVEKVGLEDAGAIIELASTAQLERIFDDDLWRSDRIGHDERFDPERFGLWLEILLEAGEEFAVRRLTDLDPDIVTFGFCKLVLVVDVDRLAIAMANPGAYQRMLLKAMESTLYHEFDQYQVIARNSDGWDAVLSILVALDRNHRDFLDRLLERCCAEIPIDPRPTSSRARNVQGPSARRQAAMVQAMDRLAGSNSKLHLERRWPTFWSPARCTRGGDCAR